MGILYELEIFPKYPAGITFAAYQRVADQLQVIAMKQACSPYPVEDVFGRIYTNFRRYRLALDAAVQARLTYDCTIRVYPIQVFGDIDPTYALVAPL